MPRKDAPSLFELVQKNQPAAEGSIDEPPAPPEPEVPTADTQPPPPAPSGSWIRSDGERVRFSLSVIGMAVAILGTLMVLTLAYTVGKYMGGRDRVAGTTTAIVDPIEAVMQRPPTPSVLGNLSQPPVEVDEQPNEPAMAQSSPDGEWVLGLNYIWVDTFKNEVDVRQAQAFLAKADIETAYFPFTGGRYRLFVKRGFDYADADDKAACMAMSQRIEELGQRYLKDGGRYKFGLLVKKMTEPW